MGWWEGWLTGSGVVLSRGGRRNGVYLCYETGFPSLTCFFPSLMWRNICHVAGQYANCQSNTLMNLVQVNTGNDYNYTVGET